MKPEKKLSAKWTSELVDLPKYMRKPKTDKERLITLFNPKSLEDEMTEYLSKEILEEIDRELVADMFQLMRNE